MACACKVNRDLTYLQKKYGIGGPKSKKTDIRGGFKNIIYNGGTFIVVAALLPLIVLHTIFLSVIKKGRINITDFIGFKKLKTNV